MSQIKEFRNLGIQELGVRMKAYLVGVKHGISLTDLDHHYDAQIKEIDDMLAALKEDDGKESAAENHPRP